MTLRQILALLKRATRLAPCDSSIFLEREDNVARLCVYNYNFRCTVAQDCTGEDMERITLKDIEKQVTRKGEKVLEDASNTIEAPINFAKGRGDLGDLGDLIEAALDERKAAHQSEEVADISRTEFNGSFGEEMLYLLDAMFGYRVSDRPKLDQIIVRDGCASYTNGHFLLESKTTVDVSLPPEIAAFAHVLLSAKGNEDGRIYLSTGKMGKKDVVVAQTEFAGCHWECVALYPEEGVKVESLHHHYRERTSFSSEAEYMGALSEQTALLLPDQLLRDVLGANEGAWDDALFAQLTEEQRKVKVERTLAFEYERATDSWSCVLGFKIKQEEEVKPGKPFSREDYNEVMRAQNSTRILLDSDIEWSRGIPYKMREGQDGLAYKAKLEYIALALERDNINNVLLDHQESRDTKWLYFVGERYRGIVMGYQL